MERPDALLPTVGGQTGLNLAVELADRGILERYGVELIGASPRSVRLAEDRDLFKQQMAAIGLETPHGLLLTAVDQVAAGAGRTVVPADPACQLHAGRRRQRHRPRRSRAAR